MSADDSGALLPLSDRQSERLHEFEYGLDPGRPQKSARPPTIIGYGEISTTFLIPGLEGFACKRMAGFPDQEAATSYVRLVARYIDTLTGVGVRIVDTKACQIESRRRHVVYLVQPLLEPARFGHKLLHTADDTTLLQCIDRVLEYAQALQRRNASQTDGNEIAVDAQLSNWHYDFAEGVASPPTLVDVGTPFMRKNGEHELDTRFLLAPVPQPLRWYYARKRAVETYLDDYFDTRKLILDLLCNFFKEGRPDRISLVLEHVNRWIQARADELTLAPVSAHDVEAYYEKDAASLELYMRLRKLDRFVRTKVLGQRYNYTLPGPVKRR